MLYECNPVILTDEERVITKITNNWKRTGEIRFPKVAGAYNLVGACNNSERCVKYAHKNSGKVVEVSISKLVLAYYDNKWCDDQYRSLHREQEEMEEMLVQELVELGYLVHAKSIDLYGDIGIEWAHESDDGWFH